MNKSLPIKIRRYRRYKFTEKRNPYKKYLDAKWKWTDIFYDLDNLINSIKQINVWEIRLYDVLLSLYF